MFDWDGYGDAGVARENFEEIECRGVEFDPFCSNAANDLPLELDTVVAVPACGTMSVVRREGMLRRQTDHSLSNSHPSLGTMTAFSPSRTCILRLTPSVISALSMGPTSFSSSPISSFDPIPEHILLRGDSPAAR